MQLVSDYFRWRNEDAARNALNAWCYGTLRKDGRNEREATKRLVGLPVSGKNEFHGEPTNTCLAIGPDDADKIDAITGQLQLL